MGSQSKYLHAKCVDVIHPAGASCDRFALQLGKRAYISAAKLYGPLFLVSALLNGKITDVRFLTTKVIPAIARSSLFITLIGALWCRNACILVTLFKNNHKIMYFISPFLAALAGILVEKEQRRGELTIYVTNQATEAVARMLRSRGYVRPIPNGLTYMFAMALAVLLYFLKYDRSLLGGAELEMLKLTVGIEGKKDMLEANLLKLHLALRRIFIHKDSKASQLCTHYEGCKSYAFIGFAKAFLIGYLIRGFLSLLPAILAPRKLVNRSVLKAALGSGTLRFALFFGSVSGVSRGVQCLMRYLRDVEDGMNQLVAGLVAGFAFLLNGSTELSMYVASKAAFSVYKALVKAKKINPIPHGGVLLFSLSTAILFHNSLFEPHNLRPSYWAFLVKASGGTFAEVFMANTKLREELGIPGDQYYRIWYEKHAKRLLKPFANPKYGLVI